MELTATYRERFFADVDRVWASRVSEPAQECVLYAYPTHQVSDDTVRATDEWLAQEATPPRCAGWSPRARKGRTSGPAKDAETV